MGRLSGMVIALAFCAGTAEAGAQELAEAEQIDPLVAYEQTLREGRFHTGATLSVADVAYSFDKHLTGMDARESAKINEWHGVHQDNDVATVLFSITALDPVFTYDVAARAEARCRRLNDGRWFCRAEIDSMRIDAAFYIEVQGEGETGAEGEAATASQAPVPPPRR